VREKWSLVILSVKKEAKLSASELADLKEGKGDEDLLSESKLKRAQSGSRLHLHLSKSQFTKFFDKNPNHIRPPGPRVSGDLSDVRFTLLRFSPGKTVFISS